MVDKYLGALCKRQHNDGTRHSWRYSGNRTCVECTRIRTEETKSITLQRLKEQKAKNPGFHEAKAKKWREDNYGYFKAYNKEWALKNPHKRSASQNKRRAAKLQAMPMWADQDKILEFYIEAQRVTESTGIKHEVDHIVPLQGKYVSGLHVPDNLQVLTAVANRQKSNKFLEV